MDTATATARPLSRTEICGLLLDFESDHAVEDYRTDTGWNAWPIVRYNTAKRLHLPGKSGQGSGASGQPDLKSQRDFFRKSWRLAHRLLDQQFSGNNPFQSFSRPGAEIVLLTQTSRRESIDGQSIQYLADPFVEQLEHRGLSVRVWEIGERATAGNRSHHWIDGALAAEWKLHRLRFGNAVLPPAPPWFDEYADWFSQHSEWTHTRLERELNWSSHAEALRHIDVLSQAFEQWLRRAGCRMLLVDCWVTRQAMAAILAARRLGIPTIEIQHGLIASNNYMYNHWSRVPDGGFEVMPSAMWFWGTDTASRLASTDTGRSNQIVGGNLWLNEWRSGSHPLCSREVQRASKMIHESERSILYTAQPQVDADIVCAAIESSPRSWRWLVRLHRSQDPKNQELVRRVQQLGLPNATIHQSRDIPLYALLKTVDVHVTGFSTCAHEALAFGVATVLIDDNGKDAFARELAEGGMLFAADATELVRLIPLACDIPAALCLQLSETLYAPDDVVEGALDAILRRMNPSTAHAASSK